MPRDDGGGSSTSNEPQDWTNSYTPLHVDISDLRDYWRKTSIDLYSQTMTATSGALAPIPEMIGAGLLGMGGGVDPTAGVFPEAVVLARILTDNHSKFAAFFKDVGNGIQCIGDAAGVIAEIYRSGDAENSANLNDVLFAFNDPDGKRPDRLPHHVKTDSFAEQQAAAAAKSGQYAIALTASDDQATSIINPASGVTIYLFSDGSSKTVTTTQTSASDTGGWAAGTTTTTTYTYNGAQVGRTTQSEYTERGGYKEMVTQTSPGTDPNAPGSAKTDAVTNPDGSQTVTSTTVGADGKAHTSNPVTVPASSSSGTPTNDPGPVQQAEQKYQTSGDKDYVQQHGAGY